ncbi:hypothetical protein F4679DRAFT_324643 [Xylaria curta]|nr:hypothetical protein F4679DRAFT_324643 [Xylaria curta]
MVGWWRQGLVICCFHVSQGHLSKRFRSAGTGELPAIDTLSVIDYIFQAVLAILLKDARPDISFCLAVLHKRKLTPEIDAENTASLVVIKIMDGVTIQQFKSYLCIVLSIL